MDPSQMMGMSANVGMMNAMRTGSPILDMLVCMMIPVLFGWFMGNSDGDPMTRKALDALRSFSDWLTGTRTYIRVIEYEDRGDHYFGSDDRSALDTSSRNNILQKAVKMYMQEHCRTTLDEAEIYLLPQKEVKLEKGRWGDDCIFSGSYKQLLCYGVTRLPKKDRWLVIEAQPPEISFRQCLRTDEEGEGQGRRAVRTVTYELRARGAGAAERVDGFINKAFDWYKQKKGEEVDHSRYLYQPMIKSSPLTEEDKGDDKEGRKYKRYLLSDNKSFDTLFFPEKELLIKLVDDFRDTKGKFAIPGFPNKLGVLLDGPPGTGKTSLIKALAIYLKRHIVSVSLEKIKTNQELMDMMFDLTYNVAGEDEPIKMKFNEVIFVMEDVDCASSVVYARKKGTGSNSMDAMPAVEDRRSDASPSPDPSPAAAAANSVPEKSAVAPVPLARSTSAPDDPSKYRRNAPFNVAKLYRQMSNLKEDSEDEELGDSPKAGGSSVGEEKAAEPQAKPAVKDDEDEESDAEEVETKKKLAALAASDKKDGKSSGLGLGLFDDLDKLNLSGLLNVLDGVVDTPGRVLIMTTNHPEKLDPALIRPGRINKRIHLGYVSAETMLQMAKHYICRNSDLPPHARKEAEAMCSGGRGLTPAWVEQCAAESEDFDGLIRHLQLLKTAALPGGTSAHEKAVREPVRMEAPSAVTRASSSAKGKGKA